MRGKTKRGGRGTGFGCGAAAGVVGAAALLAGSGGCSTNTATGRSYFNSLTREQEIALGTEAAPQLAAEYGGAVQDAALQGYLREVGLKLAQQTEDDGPSLPWEFTLLDSEVINAFALPGGKVFMSRGLADQMTSEAQLAGVLGHEVGHVLAEHVDDRIGRSQVVNTGVQLIGVLAGSSDGGMAQLVPAIVGQAGQGYLLRFGRAQELEADALGMRYMERAGYNPRGQREVMEILAAASEGPRQAEFFSTHPHPESRIAQIDELLATTYADTQNNKAYGTFESRFQDRYLKRSRAMGPAAGEGRRGIAVAFAPEWCAVCAR